MLPAAQEHPDRTWVFLDHSGPPSMPNMVAVNFAHEEGSYLVGAAAALETATGRIGFIGANRSAFLIEEFRAGYEQGAAAARPGVEIVSALISPEDVTGREGYGDPVRARQIAEWMYAQENVDVIFTAAGNSGAGVIEAATEVSDEVGRQLWAIGVDTDFVFELPSEQREHLLTSMLKRFDVAIERVVADHEDDQLATPSTITLGLADDGVGYSTSGGNLRASTIATLDELEVAIVERDVAVEKMPRGDLRQPP
jgi:basic membrane protein A